MPAKQISVTVSQTVYEEFEALRVQAGQKRSEAVEQAIKLWIKSWNDALIAEGCRASKEEDLALAKAGKTTALKALSRTLK